MTRSMLEAVAEQAQLHFKDHTQVLIAVTEVQFNQRRIQASLERLNEVLEKEAIMPSAAKSLFSKVVDMLR